ncbi:MAG: LysR substrate-binding domain-containing protein [Actinomycetota bacterium]
MIDTVNRLRVDRSIDSFDVSDRWLRIFHVAARERSFTAAGRVLGVGQPSVSHAIRQLERSLGATLFDRSASPIELTPRGTDLWRELAPALHRIDRAVARLRDGDRSVAVSVSTSFATWWLLPRLPAFKLAHPDIELRCITSDDDERVGRDEADVWIPHGPGPWPAFDQVDLAPERIVAVAAPSIAEDLSDPSSPVAVAEAPLIHLEEGYTPRFDWRRWCTAKNVELPVGSAIVSNDYAIVVQAALDGQGVALGWNHIVAPLVENGRLVPVGGAAIETDAPFVILTRRGHDSEAIDRLTSWLTAAAG